MDKKRKILFVDDEPMILHGLRGLLRKQRKKWQMSFVTSADEAYDELSNSKFDVVLTDMQMPNKDGIQLLKRVKHNFPEVIRIILSGQSQQLDSMKALHLSHRYLSKPCSPKELIHTIENTLRLTELIKDGFWKTQIGELGSLPSMPRTYQSLSKAIKDIKTTASDLVKIVESDIAITAKVLQVVNSSFFGLAKRITSIERAIIHLGTNVLQGIVLSEEVWKYYNTMEWPEALSIEQLQEHSYSTAQIATLLGKNQKIPREDLFISGLLHDVGKLIIASKFPDKYAEMISKNQSGHYLLEIFERQEFNISHAEIGGYLLGIWGIPIEIVEAVSFHHRPQEIENESLSLIDFVYISDHLARIKYDKIDLSQILEQLDCKYLKTRGLEDELLNLLSKTKMIES